MYDKRQKHLFELFNLPSPKLMANEVSGGVSSLGLFAGVFLGFLLTQLETCSWEFCFRPWIGLMSKTYCQLELISLDSPYFNLNLPLSIFHLHLRLHLHFALDDHELMKNQQKKIYNSVTRIIHVYFVCCVHPQITIFATIFECIWHGMLGKWISIYTGPFNQKPSVSILTLVTVDTLY